MSLQGMVSEPECTCGTPEEHRPSCMLVAWSQPNAMANPGGEVFYPIDAGDARYLARYHHATPLRPDVFPFNLSGLR